MIGLNHRSPDQRLSCTVVLNTKTTSFPAEGGSGKHKCGHVDQVRPRTQALTVRELPVGNIEERSRWRASERTQEPFTYHHQSFNDTFETLA